MTKFHINKHGVPAPCRAKVGNCPLGGEEAHFDTQEEAQISIDEKSQEEFGLLGTTFPKGSSEEETQNIDSNKDNKLKTNNSIAIDKETNYEEQLNEFGKRINKHTRQLIKEVEQWLDDTEV